MTHITQVALEMRAALQFYLETLDPDTQLD